MGMTQSITMTNFPRVRYQSYSKRYFTTYILTLLDETEDDNLAIAGNTILNKIAYNNACTKQNLDSCDDGNLGDGNSPLIIDVEEVVASIPAILEQPPDSSPQTSQAPAATVASPESVSEGALSTDSVPMIEAPETAVW